jgi:hypothetical protein
MASYNGKAPRYAFDQTPASSVQRARALSSRRAKLTSDDMTALSSLIITDLEKGAITTTRANIGTRFIDAVLEDDEAAAGRFWVQFVTGKRPSRSAEGAYPAFVYDQATDASYSNPVGFGDEN